MLIDSLCRWAGEFRDIRLAAVTSTVDELLRTQREPLGVVLLNAALRAEPDPALNVRRLIDAGHRVVVIDGATEPTSIARAIAAGAHGYLTRDHGLAALAATMRAIATGATAGTLWLGTVAEPDGKPVRPTLSEREHAVLIAYASGRTLDSTARHLGISPETAKTYLKRVKAKYQQAGLPVYTKLDLAERVRADCADGTCRGQASSAAHSEL